MYKKKKQKKLIKLFDETINIPEKSGNGTLKILASIDEKGELIRYSLTYVNHRLCHIDNGRVLGYDNSHGYHHKHYMGKEEPVDFENYEDTAKKFDLEWRALHEKAKNYYH